MNAHDILHELMYIAEQLRQAREISTCACVIDHIDDAQGKIYRLADEIGPEVLTKKVKKGAYHD